MAHASERQGLRALNPQMEIVSGDVKMSSSGEMPKENPKIQLVRSLLLRIAQCPLMTHLLS